MFPVHGGILYGMTDALYILALIVANTIQGITGFAGNVIAMPPSAMLIGVETARETLNILALLSGAFMSIWFRKDINFPALAKIIAFILPSLIAGIAIYEIFPAEHLLLPYGFVIVCLGIWYMMGAREKPLPTAVMVLLVIGSGLMQGMFVSGGPLLVVYAATVLRTKESFRATLSVVWLILNTVVFIQSLFVGAVTPEVVHYSALGIIPIIAATIVGGRLQKRINQALFMKLTYVLLILSGALLVFNALV